MNEDDSNTAGDTCTLERLPAVQCASWCEEGTGHTDAWHPDDQWCHGPEYIVKLSRMPLERYVREDGSIEQWRDDVRVALGKEREGLAYVTLGRGERGGFALDLHEAGELRDALTALLVAASLNGAQR